MSRRPEHPGMIAAAAGAPSRPVPAVPVPPSLRAAACDLRGRNVALRLDVGGAEAVAVVSGPGDPVQWWAAIWDMVWPAAVIDVSDVTPPGLNAVAWHDLYDELNLYVPDALPPTRQRAAARQAMRAYRGRGWRTLPRVSSAAPLGAPGTGQFRQASARRVHLASWATVSAVLAAGAAASFLAFAPQHHDGSAPGARSPAPSRTGPAVPAAQPRAVSHGPGSRAAARPPRATPRAVHGGVQSGQATSPPAQPSPGHRRAPGPGPTPSSQPTPSPSTSPSLNSHHCVVILGVRVCAH